MIIQFEKRFLKDIKLLKDKNLKEEILNIISRWRKQLNRTK